MTGVMSRALLALATALVALVAITTAAVAADPREGDVLPDLDMATPDDLSAERVRVGRRWVVRLGFAASSENLGRGPLTLHGRRVEPGRGPMVVDQLVTQAAGGLRVERSSGRLQYTVHPDHRHWHLMGYARYELRAPGDDRPSVRSDRKTGFCLGDRYTVANARRLTGYNPTPLQGDTCGLGRPELRSLFVGISPGYGDRYEAQLEGQYIDITQAPARDYVLVHTANGDRSILESSYANNSASVLFSLSWPRGRDALPRIVVRKRCPASSSCVR